VRSSVLAPGLIIGAAPPWADCQASQRRAKNAILSTCQTGGLSGGSGGGGGVQRP